MMNRTSCRGRAPCRSSRTVPLVGVWLAGGTTLSTMPSQLQSRSWVEASGRKLYGGGARSGVTPRPGGLPAEPWLPGVACAPSVGAGAATLPEPGDVPGIGAVVRPLRFAPIG